MTTDSTGAGIQWQLQHSTQRHSHRKNTFVALDPAQVSLGNESQQFGNDIGMSLTEKLLLAIYVNQPLCLAEYPGYLM